MNGTSNEFLEINDANQAYDDSNNDSAKLSYESGSNFMLLLEDFGEYFYNYNGSDFNSTLNEYQANCSLSNRTCEDVNASEYFLLINYNGLLKWDFSRKSVGIYFFSWRNKNQINYNNFNFKWINFCKFRKLFSVNFELMLESILIK